VPDWLEIYWAYMLGQKKRKYIFFNTEGSSFRNAKTDQMLFFSILRKNFWVSGITQGNLNTDNKL